MGQTSSSGSDGLSASQKRGVDVLTYTYYPEEIGVWFALLSMLLGMAIGLGLWLRLQQKKNSRKSVTGARMSKDELGWIGEVH